MEPCYREVVLAEWSPVHRAVPCVPAVLRGISCVLCGRVYYNLSSLRKHWRSHSGATTCRLCGIGLSRVAHLQRHLRNVHGLSREDSFRVGDAASLALGERPPPAPNDGRRLRFTGEGSSAQSPPSLAEGALSALATVLPPGGHYANVEPAPPHS